MPISGSGLGDEWASQTQLGPRELETTASVVVNKQALAIVADTIVLSFTKLSSGLWDYKAASDQPMLSYPNEVIRSPSLLLKSKDDDSNWGKFYDDLVKAMPAETAARLLREKEKVKEERDSSYEALDQLLMTAASGLAYIESTSNLETSVATKNQALNLALPAILAENFGKLGETILDGAMKFVDSVGANDPHYDKLVDNISQANKSLVFMKSIGN